MKRRTTNWLMAAWTLPGLWLVWKPAPEKTVPRGEIVPQVGHQSALMGLALSPDGKTLASVSDSLKLWDMPSGALRRTIPLSQVGFYGVLRLTFSPDGRYIAFLENGYQGPMACLTDLQNGSTQRLKLTGDYLRDIVFSSNCLLRGFTGGGQLVTWDVPTKKNTGQAPVLGCAGSL